MQATQTLPANRQRAKLGLLASAVAIAGAVLAALLTASGDASLVRSIEGISFGSQSLLQGVVTALPLGYAFGVGMFAAVNPCGFALLPAYLGFYMGDRDTSGSDKSLGWNLLRAAQVSVMVTLGFVLLFGVIGLVLSLISSAIASLFPLVGLLVGIALVIFGGRLLGGGSFHSSLADRLAQRAGSRARQISSRGYLAYGVAYGAASLGCTLPLFMVVVVFPLTQGGFGTGMLQFLLYALGMGSVVTALTLSTAFMKKAAVSRVAVLGRWMQVLSPVLLLVAGSYVIYYWLTLGGLLDTIRGA